MESSHSPTVWLRVLQSPSTLACSTNRLETLVHGWRYRKSKTAIKLKHKVMRLFYFRRFPWLSGCDKSRLKGLYWHQPCFTSLSYMLRSGIHSAINYSLKPRTELKCSDSNQWGFIMLLCTITQGCKMLSTQNSLSFRSLFMLTNRALHAIKP